MSDKAFRQIGRFYLRNLDGKPVHFGNGKAGEDWMLRPDPDAPEVNLQLMQRHSKEERYQPVCLLARCKGREEDIFKCKGLDGQRWLLIPNRYETPGDLVLLELRQ